MSSKFMNDSLPAYIEGVRDDGDKLDICTLRNLFHPLLF